MARPPITPELEKRIAQLAKAHHAVNSETRVLLGKLHEQGVLFPDLLTHLLGDVVNASYRIELILKSEYLLDAKNPPGRYHYCLDRSERNAETPSTDGREAPSEQLDRSIP